MTGSGEEGVQVRPAGLDDALDGRRVLDGALLDVPEDMDDRIREGDVLVAVDADSVVGVLVLDGSHVEAVAVRRRRRGNGVGSELVEAAAGRVDGTLTVDFRPEVQPFYESLGFDSEEVTEGRGSGTNRRRGRLDQRFD